MPGIARSGRLLDETSDFIDEGMCAVFLECSCYFLLTFLLFGFSERPQGADE